MPKSLYGKLALALLFLVAVTGLLYGAVGVYVTSPSAAFEITSDPPGVIVSFVRVSHTRNTGDVYPFKSHVPPSRAIVHV